jgi:hypothetical protein
MRTFIIAITTAASLLASAAFAQEPRQGTAAIPDLSGIWGRNFSNFEPPSSGSGPVLSKLRRPNGTLVFIPMVGDCNNPILKPKASEAVKNSGEMELSGTVHSSPHNQCWPEQTPFVLQSEFGMQIIQQKDEVVLLYLSDHQVRHVYMDVPHSEHPAPTWQRDSVGRYEGDTLVIDTISQKVGPLSMADKYGTPLSATLHVIERYRLIDGAVARDLRRKHETSYFPAGSPFGNVYGRGDIDPDTAKPGLQVEITVNDPATFTTPWSAFVTYRGMCWASGPRPYAPRTRRESADLSAECLRPRSRISERSQKVEARRLATKHFVGQAREIMSGRLPG